MEETLYDIEIYRGDGVYIGRIFSDIDGVKEFRSEHLDQLLRDITIDIQLALEEFVNRSSVFTENLDEEG
ncbi:MAG: hypothetical protein DRN12_01575 [Thermoplasmata archaeon]|nr:MAG: hypothetical protein DRN12_01575 [Thermoplasmata archaeon]HEC89331.1 hypothetical protein [Thermoplasmatales archaeon]